MEKSKEYMAYLVARSPSSKKVKRKFENVGKTTRTEARVKKLRIIIETNKNTIVFPAECNPRGPDVNAIFNKHEHILQHNTLLKELFATKSFIVANKRAKNLREMVARADPSNIKMDLLNQTDHGYKRYGLKCDSCNNFVLEKTSFVCFATGTKFRTRRDSICDTKNVIYLAYCKKCNKQGVGSCIEWKPRLRNYKSHIKNKNPTCRIVKHFIDDCNDPHLPFKYLGFLIIDVFSNVDDLSQNDIESLLLQKGNFWIENLGTKR